MSTTQNTTSVLDPAPEHEHRWEFEGGEVSVTSSGTFGFYGCRCGATKRGRVRS